MSAAASQYAKFREQVAREGSVFTFQAKGEFLVYRIREQEVVPFWSSRSRLTAIQRRLSKYRQYDILEMPVQEFLQWLPDLQKQQIHIGANWSGRTLTGYDVAPADLVSGINYWLEKITRETETV